ncbi:MAG: hypothetical protein NT031_14890 [Planctomycetota bacterium]|nr:hypothetical protein [Planctomycetota bacterium]
MTNSVEEALTALRGLGSVEQMNERAAAGLAPAVRPASNSHIHLPPNFSAFESVQQAVELAARQGVGALGVSNYYDYDVYGEFVAEARRHGIFPLFGLEVISLVDELVAAKVKVNDPNNPGRMYICGKGITKFHPMSPRAAELIGQIRACDDARMAQMTGLTAKAFAAHGVDTKLDAAAVIDRIVARHECRREVVTIQERHIAQAFQERLFDLVSEGDRVAKLNAIFGTATKAAPTDAVKIQGEIRTHLMKAGRPAFVTETFLKRPEAVELILELGGIPCYPTLADGTAPICEYEAPVERLIASLQADGVTCVEFIPIRNKPDVLSAYVKAIRAAGIVVAAGTEHNTLNVLALDPQCVKGLTVPEDLKDIFWEGTCVTAAHQFLNLHRRCGFVDGAGRPNPHYPTAQERIAAFARLGAAVIETYYRSNRK